MKRQICTVLLLCSLAFAVAGCGKKSDEQEVSAEQTQDEVSETDVTEETTEETTAETMKVEESGTIVIDENSEGSLTPD